MPEDTVSVARPGRWGNPFRVGVDGDAAECVRKFRDQLIPYSHEGPRDAALTDFLLSDANISFIKSELRGKNLACWCKEGPCHADVLLEIANS